MTTGRIQELRTAKGLSSDVRVGTRWDCEPGPVGRIPGDKRYLKRTLAMIGETINDGARGKPGSYRNHLRMVMTYFADTRLSFPDQQGRFRYT